VHIFTTRKFNIHIRVQLFLNTFLSTYEWRGGTGVVKAKFCEHQYQTAEDVAQICWKTYIFILIYLTLV